MFGGAIGRAMMQVINVCWGTGCEYVLQCRHSDANQPESHPGAWLKHYYPKATGDSCTDFNRMATPMRRWGNGKLEEND